VPSIESNRTWWAGSDAPIHWARAGDNWSDAFGDPRTQWYGSLLTRIQRFVPAPTVLEIAPGFGRWTHYLRHLASRLIIVDLSERCVDACRTRFSDSANIEYHVNDGTSLAMVADGSVDFAFSFDSLVHVEISVLEAYLRQLKSKLAPQGAAFIHHSNIGHFTGYFDLLERLPRGRGLLSRLGLVDGSDQKRARSVTAEAFQQAAEGAGLSMVSQEIIPWSSVRPIDCISVVTQPGSRWDTGFRRVHNPRFDTEAALLRQVGGLYGGGQSDLKVR
jgi:SAM-dependent methyltransferase